MSADIYDANNLMVMANDIRKEYNKTRDHWYHDCVRCYHQSIAGSLQLEKKIQEEFEKCIELKKKYNDISDILRKRNGYVPSLNDKWHYGDTLIKPITV